jgi:hypothetical protein
MLPRSGPSSQKFLAVVLNKDDDEHQHHDFSTAPVQPPETCSCPAPMAYNRRPTDTAQHHHHEGVHDVAPGLVVRPFTLPTCSAQPASPAMPEPSARRNVSSGVHAHERHRAVCVTPRTNRPKRVLLTPGHTPQQHGNGKHNDDKRSKRCTSR